MRGKLNREMADKTAAMQKLLRYGIPTPFSLLVTASNVNRLNALINSHSDIDYWYLRFEEQAAPTLPRVASSVNLIRVLSDALRNAENLSVIVQERITARNSGVMAVRPDALFVEHVTRELQVLLRAGATPTRTLVSRSGGILNEEQNQQEFFSFWDREEFKRSSPAGAPSSLSSNARDQLVFVARRLEECCVLEWIEKASGEIVFLDYRAMPEGFLIGAESLALSFESHVYRTLASHGSEISLDTHASGVFCLDRPLYEHTVTVLPAARNLSISAGGVLAHLCVYACEHGIPCQVFQPRK
jgi:hypothetical protein